MNFQGVGGLDPMLPLLIAWIMFTFSSAQEHNFRLTNIALVHYVRMEPSYCSIVDRYIEGAHVLSFLGLIVYFLKS